MATLILILIAVSIAIFIYESIILPSIRLKIRYKLFALRDKLRTLKVEREDFEDLPFKYAQESMNMALAYLRHFDIASFIEAERFFKQHPAIYKKATKRCEVLDSCKIEEFQVIRHQYIGTLVLASAANSFGLLVLFLITIVPVIIIFKWFKVIKSKAIEISSKVFSIPGGEYEAFEKICIC